MREQNSRHSDDACFKCICLMIIQRGFRKRQCLTRSLTPHCAKMSPVIDCSNYLRYIPISAHTCTWINYNVETRRLSDRYTLLEKKAATPPFRAIQTTWIEFSRFQGAEIDITSTYACSPTKSDLTLAGLSLQCQEGSSKSQTTACAVISTYLPLHCGKFESIIAYFFPNSHWVFKVCGIRHKCLHLPVRACDKVLLMVAYIWLCQPQPLEACSDWNLCARKVHQGSSE